MTTAHCVIQIKDLIRKNRTVPHCFNAIEIKYLIRKGCGAKVEWYFRGTDCFTISGDRDAVDRAVLFCVEHGICSEEYTTANIPPIEDDSSYDEEPDVYCAYVKAP